MYGSLQFKTAHCILAANCITMEECGIHSLDIAETFIDFMTRAVYGNM